MRWMANIQPDRSLGIIMKAIDFAEFGSADVLQLREVPDPELRPADLLVRTRAAGVNRADINHRNGVYGRPNFGDSALMGLEMAGEVIAIGPEVRGFQLGDRVMGIVGGGGYAQIARIDYRMAIPVPDSMTYIQAAAIPEVFVTAHEALIHLGRLGQGETVLVQAAASGVGSAALQMARAVGASAIFGLADGAKLDRVREFGAHRGIDRHTEDYAAVIADETQGTGVDVIIDFVGAANLERNLRSLALGGRLVQVGLMGGRGDGNLPMDLLLSRRLPDHGHRHEVAVAGGQAGHGATVLRPLAGPLRARCARAGGGQCLPAGRGRRGSPPHGGEPERGEDHPGYVRVLIGKLPDRLRAAAGTG